MKTGANYEIIYLDKEQWKGTRIPMPDYTTMEYYDVQVSTESNRFQIQLGRKELEKPIVHMPEEYDYPDRLYADYWEKAYAWGMVDSNGQLLACIETCQEEWSNRLIVTELWVHEKHRRTGIGHTLMAIAKEQARLERRRAIVLETQSCNVNAIRFYLAEGFQLIGVDTCCYSNQDIERKEVRMNFGILFENPPKLTLEEIQLQKETREDYFQTEEMTMRAFWNKYQMGCEEHFLVHNLRKDSQYVPELSRIARKDGKVIGAIFYAKAHLKKGEEVKEILTFGPLCVAPDYQKRNLGNILLEETIDLARKAGYEGIVIFGEPDYYPRFGFKACEHLGITTIDGETSPAFMGYELVEGALSSFGGVFIEPKVYEEISKEQVEVFQKQFPTLRKIQFPFQWK